MANTRELSQLASVIHVNDETKNVGIGTTISEAKLSVGGNVIASGSVNASSFYGDGSNLTGLSTFSGNYNDLTNKPSIPSDTGDLTNNAGFVTSEIVVGYATEGYVTQQVTNLIGGAPEALDTLNELAAALNDDASFATTITNSLSTKISGVGIQSAGNIIGTGITTLNFIGAGNTFAVNGTTVDVSIAGGGGGGASVSISTEAPSNPNEGDLWYSSILGRTFIYYVDENSSQWVDSAPFNIPEPPSTPGKSSATFTATEGQTTFTFSYTAGYIDVFLNGIRLNSAEYIATNGSTITLLQGATVGDVLDVVEYRMGIGDTGPQGPAAALTISTRSGVVTQNITGIAFTVSLRSGIGTVSI